MKRGNAYCEINENNEAISNYSSAIELERRNIDVYFKRGMLYEREKRYKEAAGDYSTIIDIDPKNAKAYYYRGDVNKLRTK